MAGSTTLPARRPAKTNQSVAQKMQDVLSGTYGVYLVTHNYHWNVEGEKFYALHKLLEEQYNELFQAIDVIAERIRALDEYALPFEGEDVIEAVKTISNPFTRSDSANNRAVRMVQNLVKLNEDIVKTCQSAKDACQNAKDDETEDILIERITAHQKAAWMLRSIIK